MAVKNNSVKRVGRSILGLFFSVISVFTAVNPVAFTTPVFAETNENSSIVAENVATEPNTTDVAATEAADNTVAETADNTVTETTNENSAAEVIESENNAPRNDCRDSLNGAAWVICDNTSVVSEAVDWLYDKIQEILIINPIEAKDGEPIYELWKYFKGVTNIVFTVFLLVVIYSQITGAGISNYGIKKVLPKLIVAAVLVNFSFILCSVAVDLSNILGESLRGVFVSIQDEAISNMDTSNIPSISMGEISSILNGAKFAGIGIGAVLFESGSIWMFIPVVLGAIVAVASGLITIAMRQAVVTLLVMISPLAMVAYMLPNTEQWFKKWKQLFTRMLVFYPLFSLLFGASSLAGWALVAGAKDGFWIILGMGIQIFPLFFSWSLMKMSGTFLGTINTKLRGLAARPLAANRKWAESRRDHTKLSNLARQDAFTPSLKLSQYLVNRRIAREAESAEFSKTIQNRGLAYGVGKNYRHGDIESGILSREGKRAYTDQARNIEYSNIVLRHKGDMNEGFYDRVKNSKMSPFQIKEIKELDTRNMDSSDVTVIEQARAEKIDYRNALSRHERFHDAVNAHFDEENMGRADYKRHFEGRDEKYREALARYDLMRSLMNDSKVDTQYAEAMAAHGYDSQAKVIATKMQKYFELTPPTKDNMYRLQELSKHFDKEKLDIDSIVAGLRVINQRGDTDLVKSIVDDLVNEDYGGLRLGSHASQALASFLMFEVKDNDPFLRRFGKYINLETAQVFNEGKRKKMNVTYDEYVKGYHMEPEERDEDGNIVRGETISYAKKSMKTLVEGTSLDNVERTAFSNLDESLKKAYGYDSEHKDKKWDVDGYLRKREEIQTSMEPAFLSAGLKWLSGSEQMNSAVKFWTGYGLTQLKDEDGNKILDEYGDPKYGLEETWNADNGFASEEDREKARKYFQRMSTAWAKDQTTNQILGMRTDFRDAMEEHWINEYFDAGHEDERAAYASEMENIEDKRAEALARINETAGQTEDEKKAARTKVNNEYDKKVSGLKEKIAGKHFRKVMGETGKLKQIYRTRTSGTAINAKDWLRRLASLDDERALREEVTRYDNGNTDKMDILDVMHRLNDKKRDKDPKEYFEATKQQLELLFGDDDRLMIKEYENYFNDSEEVTTKDLYDHLKELIERHFEES